MKRNRVAFILLVITCMPFYLYAQTCNEGAGQTNAFTLKAGAKATWDSSVPIVEKQHGFSYNRISLFVYKASSGGIVLKTTGLNASSPYSLSIFSVTGQKISFVAFNGNAQVVFRKNLAQGICFARLESNGEILKAIRFMVGR
jgi:hypothetical protein